MKTKNLILGLLLLVFFTGVNAQTGNVKIGAQVWTSANLDVTTFRNGDPIPEAESDADWNKANQDGKPAWCYNKKDTINNNVCGKLYNWYAVNDARGLAPKGWHVASRDEWLKLLFDNGTARNTNIFKSTTGWEREPESMDNPNGNNSSGFSAYPGGYREYNAESFQRTGTYGVFWTTTSYDDSSAWGYSLLNVGSEAGKDNFAKGAGLSVRLVKD